MDKRLWGKRLFIDELASRIGAWESGSSPMRALEYRVSSKTLTRMLAGYPERRARRDFGSNSVVMEALANREFEQRGSGAPLLSGRDYLRP